MCVCGYVASTCLLRMCILCLTTIFTIHTGKDRHTAVYYIVATKQRSRVCCLNMRWSSTLLSAHRSKNKRRYSMSHFQVTLDYGAIQTRQLSCALNTVKATPFFQQCSKTMDVAQNLPVVLLVSITLITINLLSTKYYVNQL